MTKREKTVEMTKREKTVEMTKRAKTLEMTGKEDSENYRITKLQLQLGFLGKIDKKS